MFQHIILTRFNLATPGREFSLRTQPDWLEHRFGLFERYCLPSFAAQTETNFRWILFFDEGTPDVFRRRIETLQQEVPFVAYFTGLFDSGGWARSVHEKFPSDEPLLLTTRIDNDDALPRDFVARLHQAVADKDHALGTYNFRNGLIRKGRHLYALQHESNAFFSLLEQAGPDIRTASSIAHMEIAADGPVHQIDGTPGWMQIVHERNVSNKIRGQLCDPAEARDLFAGGAGQDLDAPPRLQRLLDAAAQAPVRRIRDRLMTALRHR